MLPRSLRLKESRRFHAVYRHGRSWSNREMVLHVLPRPTAEKQFGFVVGKKIGGAVQRNQVRRRLREACRALVPCVTGGMDVVIVARAAAAEAPLAELTRGLRSLLQRAHVWREDRGCGADGQSQAGPTPAGPAQETVSGEANP